MYLVTFKTAIDIVEMQTQPIAKWEPALNTLNICDMTSIYYNQFMLSWIEEA